MSIFKKLISAFTSVAVAAAAIPVIGNLSYTDVNAATSYPVQEFRLGMSDTNNNVTVSDTSLVPSVVTGKNNEKWSLNFVSSGVYEIVNSSNGQILTASGSGVALAPDTNAANQRWKIEGVEKDFEGYWLYYKITSNADSSKTLTYTEGAGFGLTKYSGADYQKYMLNLDGLEGYAASSSVNGKIKAGTIGGLLGETVFVNNVADFISAIDDPEPKTVVVTADLDLVNQSKEKQRIRDNKTIVGSYSANTIYDSQLRNDDFWGKDESPSNNIVIRNMNFVARTLNSNGSGVILLQFYGVRNLWVDHNNFSATFSQNKDAEVGKFIWINTPAANWSDGCYNAVNPDYITISYNYMKNRYWTFAFGSQNTDTSRLHTTVMFNKWEECSRRCPQYSNGFDHNYCNYHTVTNGSNSNQSSQVIGGEGSRVLNENCRFEAMTSNEIDYDKNLCISFKEQGSFTSSTVGGTPSKLNATSKGTALVPSDSYSYSLVTAYNTNGTDVKDFCNNYSGCFKSKEQIKYITDSDMSKYVVTKYESPFLRAVDLSAVSPASFTDGAAYRIKNVNSNLYMQVDGAKAENNANVQQWGTADGATHDIWKLVDAGDGYYYIVSAVGDGGTYALDIAKKSTANGANVDIYQYNSGTNQQFMFTKNADGSYKIRTRISGGKSAVEVADASSASGANVQQWEINGVNCQDWILEPVSNPGCKMDTSVNYEFKNVNSGMVMDIESGKMEDNTNVQQWSTSNFKSQQWSLKAFAGGGNYYYIHSVSNPDYVLKASDSANGGNIAIAKYATNDSAMLFKFAKNPDGSYYIMTRASKDACLVEIASASTQNGANVQQWTPTNNTCQKWNAETFTTTTTTTAATTTTTTTTTTTAQTTTSAKTTTVPITSTAITTETKPTEISGDIDNDGKVEIADIVLLKKYLVNESDFTEKQQSAADLNKDGKINIFDFIILKNILVQ